MFRDASQPVRSNKPTQTVCVIRLLVIPPTSIADYDAERAGAIEPLRVD
jgi:hypothetical protein